MSAINIIFDGPPSNESGRFVEVEDDSGKGMSIGEWIKREDGYWALRITELPIFHDHTELFAGTKEALYALSIRPKS